MDFMQYVFAVSLVAFLFLFLVPRLRGRFMHGRPLPDLTGLLDERFLAHECLLFYFTSPDCSTCRPMTVVIDRVASEHDNVVKVDISVSHDLAHAFGVMLTPTLVLARHGMVEQVLVGGRSEKKIRQLLG